MRKFKLLLIITLTATLIIGCSKTNVTIKCLLTNTSYSEITDSLDFNAWVSNGDDTYIDNGSWLVFHPKDYGLSKGKDGDLYEITVKVYKDSSFGSSGIISAKKLNDTVDVNKVYEQYKASCGEYSCEDILRYPKKYRGTYMKFSGEVFQITSEEEDRVCFLLSTSEEDGYINVIYDRGADEPRILEGDQITVYGAYYILYNYTSLLGTQKSIPQLSGKFCEFD